MNASTDKPPARRQIITLRTTTDEKNAIRARARAHGLSVGSYIRFIALDKPLPKAKRFTKDQGQFVACVLASLGAMMDQLRQLEKNDDAHEAAQPLARELLFLRDQCFEALGRKP